MLWGSILIVLLSAASVWGQERLPIYLWLEPEWFEGVRGTFSYWTGTAKPTGFWSIAGPGIAAEWSQGGESEWNSIGVPAAETSARCQRRIYVPRAGKYHLWVRYVDHRQQTEPFRVHLEQQGKVVLGGELGLKDVLPPGDEYQLYWGFSFAWDHVAGELAEGPAQIVLTIDKPGQAWRQVDALLLTDDLKWVPVGREKPAFAYYRSFDVQPAAGARWRGTGAGLIRHGQRPKLGGRDFSMWTGIEPDPKWWSVQDLSRLSRYQVFFHFSPPADIKEQFHKQFAGRQDVPLMSWPGLLPGFYLGQTPDLSPSSPVHRWLKQTKTPFFILTNYATGNYTEKTGPATYAALTGPLADLFLGYIHGETIGTVGVSLPRQPLAADRRGHVEALARALKKSQAAAWSKIYKTTVDEGHWVWGIPCLSADFTSFVHLFYDMGSRVVGYEEDATMVHVPLRIAFARGAARQYGRPWINYASGNFGDACNYFTQEPIVPRGARSWFHSRYAITDGVSIAWYRKLYYLNYLGGASAIYWEQNLTNQYLLPGPGTHPIQLSPFGRATEDFQTFVDRLPDRGEPETPVAILLSYGHGYDRVNNYCRMLQAFPEDENDLELRELFNVCWHPIVPLEGLPAMPDVQSMPAGIYGDIFDVLVDRPARGQALFHYPIVWAAGDVRLDGEFLPVVEEYLRRGGTLVVNIAAAGHLPEKLLGFRPTGRRQPAEHWRPIDGRLLPATPYEVAEVQLSTATVLAWTADQKPLITRQAVGPGAVIVVLVPHLIGRDERAHPCIPYLLNGLTEGLLPISVRLADGRRPQGEVAWQINRTRDGYLILLINPKGIDKTQNGIARVDRRAFVDVVLHTTLPIQSAQEMTRALPLHREQAHGQTRVSLRIPAGDLAVVALPLAAEKNNPSPE